MFANRAISLFLCQLFCTLEANNMATFVVFGYQYTTWIFRPPATHAVVLNARVVSNRILEDDTVSPVRVVDLLVEFPIFSPVEK